MGGAVKEGLRACGPARRLALAPTLGHVLGQAPVQGSSDRDGGGTTWEHGCSLPEALFTVGGGEAVAP